jgi:hypothetical protein
MPMSGVDMNTRGLPAVFRPLPVDHAMRGTPGTP